MACTLTKTPLMRNDNYVLIRLAGKAGIHAAAAVPACSRRPYLACMNVLLTAFVPAFRASVARLRTARTLGLTLVLGLLLGACHSRAPAQAPPDALVAFRTEMLQMGRSPQQMCFTFNRRGEVVSLTISGSSMSALPAALSRFQQLEELHLSGTQLHGVPDLRQFPHLRLLSIDNSDFGGPVHLKNLPPLLNTLYLSRDHITDVLVDDTLPNLTHLTLEQHLMKGINGTFCKMPQLEYLDLSAGCCFSHRQQLDKIHAAQRILCRDEVFVKATSGFMD